jgi:catechol 2,3-dioxygenase-like lactoylglutathione lyase family enzyme
MEVHMRWMRGVVFFMAGTVFGMIATQPSAAPQEKMAGLRLNHFGIYVRDFDESMNFYTKTMGFHEAFSLKDKDGKPTLAYLQINRDTFLELAPTNADRPVGFSHVGIWANDLNTTVKLLRERGVKMEDPHAGATKAPLTNMIEPNGVRLELLEYPPESLQRKAIDGWK